MNDAILSYICEKYNISYKNRKEIDTTKEDYRLNIILDNKYVIRLNDQKVMTEERLYEIQRLINRYNSIGVYVPKYITNSDGKYSIKIDDKICYVSEYGDYPLAEDSNIDYDTLKSEAVAHLGVLATKYTGFDLSKNKSMWSIIDLSILDTEMDEKQENINSLVKALSDIGETKLANHINLFNQKNREAILKVFDRLPRCMYQGDLNDANILMKDNHFYGLIDFNLSGTEVNINCFLSETNKWLEESDFNKYSPQELLDEMINYQNNLMNIILKSYTLNNIEKQVFENYRNIILLAQYPSVCLYIDLLDGKYKDKVLELINLIVNRKIE